jgi:hypothetical protein
LISRRRMGEEGGIQEERGKEGGRRRGMGEDGEDL